MTDILDLQDWRVTSTRHEDNELIIEAEYGIPPAACMKCGVIGRLYKHGPKPITIRDSPVRGRPVRLVAIAQRYKCRECSATFIQPPICTHCSERFHTEDHPQHESLTTR